MNLLTPLLAVEGADKILESGLKTSQEVAASWDKQWLTIFQSQLYYGLVTFAGLIAAGSLIFFMFQFIRSVVNEEDWISGLQSLIIPLCVVVMLANNGAILGRSTALLRGVIHQQANKILQLEFNEVKLESALQSAVLDNALAAEMRTQVSQCYGMAGQKQIDCLQKANEQVQKTIQSVPRLQFSGQLGVVQRAVQRGIQSANQRDNGNPLEAGAAFAAGIAGSGFQDLASGLLLGFGWAFANILELSLLLNALLGPIAVAGSLALGGKPFFAWLTGFFSLGLAQVCYNIVVGLTAWVVVNAEVTDTTGFLVILGLLAPALALAMAAGGGLTTFNVISSGIAGASTMILSQSPRVPLSKI